MKIKQENLDSMPREYLIEELKAWRKRDESIDDIIVSEVKAAQDALLKNIEPEIERLRDLIKERVLDAILFFDAVDLDDRINHYESPLSWLVLKGLDFLLFRQKNKIQKSILSSLNKEDVKFIIKHRAELERIADNIKGERK